MSSPYIESNNKNKNNNNPNHHDNMMMMMMQSNKHVHRTTYCNDDAVEKFEVLSDISADEECCFMEQEEHPAVGVSGQPVTRVMCIGDSDNKYKHKHKHKHNDRPKSFSANADDVFSLSFALPPKQKMERPAVTTSIMSSSSNACCMSVDEEEEPAAAVIPAAAAMKNHHLLPNERAHVHPVTPTQERKHFFEHQNHQKPTASRGDEGRDHSKCIFRCCYGTAPAQCPALSSFASNNGSSSYTHNHDNRWRNCVAEQAVHETKADFAASVRLSNSRRRRAHDYNASQTSFSRSRLRDNYCSSKSHATASFIPRCIYVTSDVGSHGPGRHHRRAISSSSVSISTMENIDDEGWDANRRRMFFDKQRREQTKSMVGQEIRYYVGQLSPFPKRKLNKNVELKRCNGCLA